MIRFLYNLLFPVALLFFLPGYLAKMRRRGNYRENFGQRLGLYGETVRTRLASRRVTWMHAVSVGEVAVALKLAAEMKEMDRDFFCALTTTTTTGFTFARRESPEWIEVMYSPLDFWPVMRRAFAVIRPIKVVLVEAEVWPNMVARAWRLGIPVALVNARLSPRSERRFRKFRFAVAPLFRQLDLVCVPEPEDVARWTALGVSESRIQRTGNIKYDTPETSVSDAAPRKMLETFGINSEQPIIFGGSTHPGEEVILAKNFLQLRAEFPALFLIIAPRHAERARAIRADLVKLSLRVALRSESEAIRPDCLLINTTGELRTWYSVATVAFVGKSLTARGGQNPVEPIVAGKPVIFGPHMENFSSLARSLVAHHAAIQIDDAGALQDAVARLLGDHAAREKLVANARQVLASHHGATSSTARLVAGLKAHVASDL